MGWTVQDATGDISQVVNTIVTERTVVAPQFAKSCHTTIDVFIPRREMEACFNLGPLPCDVQDVILEQWSLCYERRVHNIELSHDHTNLMKDDDDSIQMLFQSITSYLKLSPLAFWVRRHNLSHTVQCRFSNDAPVMSANAHRFTPAVTQLGTTHVTVWPSDQILDICPLSQLDYQRTQTLQMLQQLPLEYRQCDGAEPNDTSAMCEDRGHLYASDHFGDNEATSSTDETGGVGDDHYDNVTQTFATSITTAATSADITTAPLVGTTSNLTSMMRSCNESMRSNTSGVGQETASASHSPLKRRRSSGYKSRVAALGINLHTNTRVHTNGVGHNLMLSPDPRRRLSDDEDQACHDRSYIYDLCDKSYADPHGDIESSSIQSSRGLPYSLGRILDTKRDKTHGAEHCHSFGSTLRTVSEHGKMEQDDSIAPSIRVNADIAVNSTIHEQGEVHRSSDTPTRTGQKAMSIPVRKRQRRKSSLGGLSQSSYEGTTFLGSYEESLLKGRMSGSSVGMIKGFTARVSALNLSTANAFTQQQDKSGRDGTTNVSKFKAMRTPPTLKIEMTALFYQLGISDQPSPYVGIINIGDANGGHCGYYKVPYTGLIQVSVYNPQMTPVKVFLVKYDHSDMPPRTKTLMRQRTSSMEGDLLQTAIHLRFVKTNTSLFVATEIRVLFPHRMLDIDERTNVSYESTPYTSLTRADCEHYHIAKQVAKRRSSA